MHCSCNLMIIIKQLCLDHIRYNGLVLHGCIANKEVNTVAAGACVIFIICIIINLTTFDIVCVCASNAYGTCIVK